MGVKVFGEIVPGNYQKVTPSTINAEGRIMALLRGGGSRRDRTLLGFY